MGHSKGRDNAKKRTKRRKKTERLAFAKKNTKKAEKEWEGSLPELTPKQRSQKWFVSVARCKRLLSAMSVSLLLGLVYLISDSGLQKNLIRNPGTQERTDG